MMSLAMAKKVLGAAASALEVARGAAQHVVWYVAHQVTGSARDSEPRERR
jgi:hypothetical protein